MRLHGARTLVWLLIAIVGDYLFIVKALKPSLERLANVALELTSALWASRVIGTLELAGAYSGVVLGETLRGTDTSGIESRPRANERLESEHELN